MLVERRKIRPQGSGLVVADQDGAALEEVGDDEAFGFEGADKGGGLEVGKAELCGDILDTDTAVELNADGD